jgi:hypothetical protein
MESARRLVTGAFGPFILNPEANFGKTEFPQPNALDEWASYQGTALAVPLGRVSWALAPARGLKPFVCLRFAARLKPCPDTRLPASEFRLVSGFRRVTNPPQVSNLPRNFRQTPTSGKSMWHWDGILRGDW